MHERILIVENERIVAFNLQQRLTRLGYEVPSVAASGSDALRIAGETSPDLVLMDIRIDGEIDGIETANRLNSSQAVPIVFLTGHADDSTLERARATRPSGYLLKPFSEREMHATIQMALERARIENALQQREEQLRAALDAAEMGIVEIDPDSGDIQLAGHAAEILGLAPDRVRANCSDLLPSAEEAERQNFCEGLRGAMHERARFQVEFPCTVPPGSQHWIQAQGSRYTRRAHARHSVIGIVQDVTERRRNEEAVRQLNHSLEQQVATRTAELRASIAALNAFSYSVAHDLRAPVRAMVGFSQIVLTDAGSVLSDECRHHLERIHAAGLHLAAMIDALLDLSRITRAGLVRRPVDLGAIAAEIAQELREAEPERAVEFVIAGNAVANADPDMIRIVLDNLLRNAWKFTSRHDRARIEFGIAAGSGDAPEYFVRDDGAGFDMANADKLFGAFQRLHLPEQFDGTGIGLATVQRIIDRHGGTLRAEAAVEVGATFYFTLPDPA